jgi:hypothetical protein
MSGGPPGALVALGEARRGQERERVGRASAPLVGRPKVAWAGAAVWRRQSAGAVSTAGASLPGQMQADR